MSERPQQSKRQSLLPDALRALTDVVVSRPKTTLGCVLVVSAACVAAALMWMQFKTDRSDLINPSAEFHQRWLAYTENFGDSSDLVVAVESDDPQQIRDALDAIGRRMEAEPQHFQSVLYRFDAGRLPAHKGLQYIPPVHLEAGLERLRDLQPHLRGDSGSLAVDAVFSQFSREFDRIIQQPDPTRSDRLLTRAERYTKSLDGGLSDREQFDSPWPAILPPEARPPAPSSQPTYFLNDAETMGFLRAFPARERENFDGDTQAVDRLRGILAEVERERPGVRIGATGIPVLENDEMRRSRADMSRAAVVSFVGVGLLLILGFRGIRHPALAMAMLAVGMAWAFGYTTLVVGHLNILSISFAVILIGLGIDFAIHYLARYLELRRQGVDLGPALGQTSAGVGAGIVAAAITTAFAFFCATFTEFLGVAELGIIAGGGILLCAAATFLVLPALVAVADRGVESKLLPTPFEGDLLRRFIAGRPVPVTVCSVLLIAGIGSQVLQFRDGRLSPRVRYDSNLLNLQADGLDSVETQKRIAGNADHSLLYAVSTADSPDEARERKRKLEALPTVNHVEELASALPAVPNDETRLLVQGYRSMLSSLADRPPIPPVNQPLAVGRKIERFYLRVKTLDRPEAAAIVKRLDGFLDRFAQLPEARQRAFLDGFQRRSAAMLHGELYAIAAASNPEPVTTADLPEPLVRRFVGDDGKWLLQVYPKDQVWDSEPLSAFVAEVRGVDSEATGTPLQNFEASRQIKTSYRTASIYALSIIVLVLLIDFLDRDYALLTLLAPFAVIMFTMMALKTRRVEIAPIWLVVTYTGMAASIAAIFDWRNLRNALLAILPAVGGGALLFGILGLLGVNLNPANLIVLPLVLGIGVDDGVHVVHDFRMQPRGTYRTSPSTMNAIVLTSLTSMIGFGSMMVAAHRGLHSVGLVLLIGVGSCLFVSLVPLPAILTLISGGGAPASADVPVDEDSSHPSPSQRETQMV